MNSYWMTMLCFTIFAFTFTIGLWALGQWLRKKGHGSKLDRINQVLAPAHVRTAREIGQQLGRSMRLENVERIPRERKTHVHITIIQE
ncbi:hypothetical protein ACNDVF_004977 [Escherichia coli]|nr:hypothetical protein [Klebsiella pneumoniae]